MNVFFLKYLQYFYFFKFYIINTSRNPCDFLVYFFGI